MMPETNPHVKPELPINPTADRFGRATGAEPEIIRDGGRFGAGIIKGVSLASVGEALGHEMWLDAETISQVQKLSEGKGETGVKARFTHPGMSSDGMGKHLGRLHNVRVEGEKVVGDLHFSKSSHTTPDGDLAEYCMSLAEEDGAAAGLSIVFHHDWDAEEAFTELHQEEHEYEDYRGRTQTRTRFKSPDERNVNNYLHVRLRELRAADIVDEPAANPSGLFDSNSLPREADELLSYAAGLSTTKPTSSSFGLDGDRAAKFLGRWLDSHGLSITPKEPVLATEEKTEPKAQTRDEYTAELRKFTEKFGAENGTRWFTEGKSFEESLSAHCEALSERLTAEIEAHEAVEAKLSSLQLGEADPVETSASDSTPKTTFAEATRRKSS